MSDTGYFIEIDGEFYSAGVRNWVAVPVTDGEHFTLATDDGEVIAEVSRIDGGYYVCDEDENADDPGDETSGVRVFSDWRVALTEWARWHGNSGRPITDAGELELIKQTIEER